MGVHVQKPPNKMWSVHTMEYHSALKRRGVLTPAVWMNFENVMFREINASHIRTSVV